MITLLPLLSALAVDARAEEPTLTPELHLRPRLEVDTGEDAAEGGERFFVVQRSRLGARAEMGPVLARAAVQDARIWGGEVDPGKVTAEDLDLRIAEVRIALGEAAAVTVGRQEIRWHEERILAIANWQPVGRVFDAARLDAASGALHLQAFGAIAGEGDSYSGDGDVGWASAEDSWTVGALAGLSGANGELADAVYLLQLDGSADLQRHTAGVYTKAARGILSGRFEGYAQLGQSGGDAIQAFMAGVYLTAAPEVTAAPKITLWYDWMSGDTDPDDGVVGAFHMVYGAKHKFMGIADIVYYQIGGFPDGLGLHDPALRLQASPAERLTLYADGHWFLAAAPGVTERHIGRELDLKASWSIAPGASLTAGGGAFQGANDRPLDAFGWLQLDVRY